MKEYLKMADVFPHAKVGKSPVKPWVSGEYFVFYENQAEYAAHAINSHDELVGEVERLRQALIDAATSLETIHVRSYGEIASLTASMRCEAMRDQEPRFQGRR